MKKTRIGRSILTLMLALVMVFELIPMSLLTAFANDPSAQSVVYPGGTQGIADLDTSTKYTLSLGDNASTEHAGRIWTDKSVYAGSASFETYGGGTLTYRVNENGIVGEDFLVAYSALATSESVEGQTQAPVDVVLILDVSGSMSNADSNMDNGYSRIYNTVQAANNAISELMALNEYTRVAVVTFSTTASVLLPLDRYEQEVTVERQWVQTGNYGWQGYWANVEVVLPYFSLSRNTGSDNYATLYTNAVNSAGDVIERSISVEGGTNIQAGLYTGMNVLATEQSTKANINGAMIQRVPSVILLSDGSPTYSSSSNTWWAPANNGSDGPGNGAYAGNGMKAIMTGAYMKAAVDRNYGVAGTNYSTSVYTIGMGISELSGDEGDLAYMTLNPGAQWNTTDDNDMRDTIKDYWADYTANNNTGTARVNVGRRDNNRYYDDWYTLTHPSANDVDPANGYDYVDNYYDADNAGAVLTVFDQIVSNISISAPQIPTEIKGYDPISDGYITYTDPIGKYMEVKDVRAIIYAGTEFKNKTVVTNGNETTYTFSGSVHSPVYGDQEITSIIIKVTKAGDGSETMTVMIPASVIPLRVNYVTLNADGSVKTHTNNGAYPTRVIYSVGMQDEIVKLDDNGGVYIDTTKVDPSYISANKNEDGSVNFYSNLFTGTNTVHGYSAGNATVEFEPSHSNRYYYILEDMPIYKDAGFKNQVTSSEGLDDNTTYYYRDDHYHGNSVEIIAVPRTGAQLKKTTIVTGADGFLYRAAGSPRTNKILDFEGTKVANATKTAEDFYAPTFEYAVGSTDPFEGKYVIYHGNNGVISLAVGGNLAISKTVQAGVGLTAPDASFVFTLDLDGVDVNQGSYDYVIVNADGTPASVGVVSKNNTTITLKDGQTATVYSLPPGTTYKVVETKTAGFTVSPGELAGTIVAGATQYAAFTNTYTVTPVTSDAIVGKKVLAGRTWQNGDSFTFCINNYNNAPLPINYDPAKGVVVTAADADANGEAAFNLGKIEFTAPGVYRYTIYEDEPAENEILPGFTYSRALYRLVVTVEDNGTGSLVIKSTDLQQLYTDGAEPLFTYNNAGEIVMNSGEEAEDEVVFTNTYSANSVVRVPVALKDYVDKSGSLPLTSGMFKFEMKAIGYILGSDPNKLVETADIPMPAGAANGVITTTNEGRNITFPSVEFTQNSIPNGEEYVIFRYRMKELVPANKLYGMNYDETEYFVDVKVSIDHTKDELDVVATYQAGVVYPTFRNEYTPDPATVYINGTKTLLGRDMKAGESFEFVLAGANATTNNAVRNGEVIVPSTVAYASNGTDGKATAFAFGGIQFNKVGTYVFSVSETAGNAPSVEYDDTVVTVTVVIADDNKDGKLEASSVTYSNGKSAAEFTNTYTAEFDGTPVTLEGYKTLLGKTLLEGEFFFNVVEYYNGTKISEGLVSHEKDTVADANGAYTGAIKFIENKTYDKTGTYVYYINEQIPTPAVGGTTYSDSEYRYTVVVQDVDKVGKITVTSKYLEVKTANGWTMANAVEFVNEYTPAPATAVLPLIKKVIAGDRSEPLKAGEFSFEIKSVSQNPAGGMTLPSTTVVSNDADGKIVFGDIVFTKPGVYTVVVSEVIPDDADKVAGITYSTQKITATYEVVDDRNGKLTAVLVNYAGGEEIINRYEAKAADVEITIEKDLQGRNWEANDSFEFEVVILDPATIAAVESGAIEFPMDVSGSGIATKVIDTEGETITGNVKIHVAGTYKFIVREITGTIPGIHYDSQPREIVIVATDNSVNAEIDVTIDGVATTKKTITFVNVYDAKSTELSGHDHLTIVKEFTGRSGNEWLDSDKFEFVLEAADKATKDAIDAGKVVLPSSTTLTVSNANKAHPHFGNIVFNAEGTYKFKVTEIEGSIPGVKYDTTSRVITVKVSDNNAGQLVAELQAGSDSLEFNNSYTPKEVVLVGSASLEIIKALTGRDWKNTDEFTFVIAPYGDITAGAIANGDIVMPSSNKLVITDESTAVDGGKKGHFGDITFKKAGSYRFVISEEEGNIDNVDYDRNTYHAIVVVTDNDAGQLVTSVNYVGSKVFVNEYTPDNAEVSISGTKELGGDDRELKADEFEFVISAVTTGAPMPSKLTAKNDAQGKIDFGTIIYIAEGVYEYKITETKGSLAGITYDADAVMVKVTVTYNAASGEFETDVKYTKGNEQPSANFRFRNIYTLKASEPLDIEIEKVVNPSEGNIFNFKGDEFSFVITGKNNAPMPVASKVTNDRNGKAKFEDIVFDKAGVYEYTVVEESGTHGGITYDSSVYNVTVTVTENKTTAQLETSLKITDSQGKDAEIVFNNKYDPKSTSVIIFGSKVLNSEHKTLEANKFSFKLEALSPTCPLPKETVVKNVDAGTFRFDTIEFTKIGEYKYRITEVDLGENGYTYDKREFIVTVVVTDEGKGELKADVTGLGTTQYPTIKFINEYVPTALKVDLFAEKVLNGRELKEGEFVFELKDADGKTVLISSNLEDGSVTFKDLKFTKAGEYKFTVSETKGSVNGIIYDNTVYNLVVIIKDEDGQLEIADATATKAGTNEEVDELIFTNTYDPTKNPQTGNSLNLPMWMAIMLISGGAALTLCIAEKKRRSSKA